MKTWSFKNKRSLKEEAFNKIFLEKMFFEEGGLYARTGQIFFQKMFLKDRNENKQGPYQLSDIFFV